MITTAPNSAYLNPLFFDRLQNSRDLQLKKIITQVALENLAELVMSLAFTGITCLFIATPILPKFLVFTVSIVAIKLLLKIAIKIVDERLKVASQLNSGTVLKVIKISLECFYICSALFLDRITKNAFIHESGHFLAIKSVYNNARPKITLLPTGEGSVSYFCFSPLTKVGKFLGEKRLHLFITAAGPLAAVSAATLQIKYALKWKEKRPQFSFYLFSTAVACIASHVRYALSALDPLMSLKKGHDFALLWKLGRLHPIHASIIMAALPIFVCFKEVGLLLKPLVLHGQRCTNFL